MLFTDGIELQIVHLDHTAELERMHVRSTTFGGGGFITNAFHGITTTSFQAVLKVTYELLQIPELIPPVSPFSQNELRWRVRYTDNINGQPGSFVVPGADFSLLPVGSEQLDIITPGSPGEVVKSWLDTRGRSEADNPYTVTAIELLE